MFQTK